MSSPAKPTAGELPAVPLFDAQPRVDGLPHRDRFLDRYLTVVDQWQDGHCLYCGATAKIRPLPRSRGRVFLPLCERHVRWAMAARRERFGKQSRILRGYIFAWVRLKGGDRAAALQWLDEKL